MITPSDSPSAPAQYAAVPASMFDIQAPQADLTALVDAANATAGPRQAQTETLLSSPQGFASQGYDIDAGYAGTWSSDVEPSVDGP